MSFRALKSAVNFGKGKAKPIIRIEIKTVDGLKWERITGVGGTPESGIPCFVADIVARDFTNKGYAVDDVKWNFS